MDAPEILAAQLFPDEWIKAVIHAYETLRQAQEGQASTAVQG